MIYRKIIEHDRTQSLQKAPAGNTVLQPLAQKEEKQAREDCSSAGASLLGDGWIPGSAVTSTHTSARKRVTTPTSKRPWSPQKLQVKFPLGSKQPTSHKGSLSLAGTRHFRADTLTHNPAQILPGPGFCCTETRLRRARRR